MNLQRCYVKQEELQKEEKMYATDGGKNLIKYYIVVLLHGYMYNRNPESIVLKNAKSLDF